MSDDTWTEPAALAWAPAFHSDPCPGGPPLFSVDGHWWWDGEHWQVRRTGTGGAGEGPRSAGPADDAA